MDFSAWGREDCLTVKLSLPSLFFVSLSQLSWLPILWCEPQQRKRVTGSAEWGETLPWEQHAESQEDGDPCPTAGSRGVFSRWLFTIQVSWILLLARCWGAKPFTRMESTGIGSEAAEHWVHLSVILTHAPDTLNTEQCTFIPSYALRGFLIP